jgi:hypothetical protein
MAQQPDIKTLRLVHDGLVQGNMNKTIEPGESVELRWHPKGLGVEVVAGCEATLVPWGSIASVTYAVKTKQSQKTKRPTPEETPASARSSARAKGPAATAGPSPGR